MNGRVRPSSPWPGPRPYQEHEWRLFYGRKREVDEVRDRISAQRLTVLTGRSGTGKTSLLCAGIVPALRLRRYRGKNSTPWPVLVLRQWGAGQQSSLEGLVRAELTQAVAGTAWWADEEGPRAREDHKLLTAALGRVREEASLLDSIERLATCKPDKIEGLILVFDQLEEVLRRGTRVTWKATELFRDLHESGLPVRLLLSLREEYLGELRGLERSVGGLMGRTVFLSPMARQTAQEAVRAAAADAKVQLAPDVDVVERVFGWLGIAEGGGEGDARPEGAEEAPDLLTLQAILHELFTEFASGPSGSPVLDGSTLERYEKKYGPDPERLAGKALGRWIERAFEPEAATTGDDLGVAMPPDRFLALMRRVAVRAAPHLSSGGYKVAQEESDLFRKAVGDDVWALGLRDPELRRKVRILRSPTPRLDLTALGMKAGDSANANLSGTALEQEWDGPTTAHHLLAAFLTAMERLASPSVNVVKVGRWQGSGTEDVQRWELVHDGLGRPLAEWAQERRDTWEDCASSVVACRGVSPIGLWPERPPSTGLDHVRWEGCHVAPVVAKAKPVLDGIEFSQCVLRGTIFEDLVFRGCRFRQCDLSGTVFRGCVFDGAEGQATVFEDCKRASSLAILDSELSALLFRSCDLSQLTLKGCQVKGAVQFSDHTTVLLSIFLLLQAAGSQRLVFEPSCQVEYCSGDEASWRLLRFECPVVYSSPFGSE